MRKTNNYGLSLYDKEDKMSVTAEENSLNANMKIIDKTLKEIETAQISFPTDEEGNKLYGEKEQVLISNGDGTVQWANVEGEVDGIPFQKRGKLVQFIPEVGTSLDCVSTIEANTTGVSKISITRCGKNLVNIVSNPTHTGNPPSNISILPLLGDENLYLTAQATLSPKGAAARIRMEATPVEGSKVGFQGNDIPNGETGISKVTLPNALPTKATSAFVAFVRTAGTTQYGYSDVQIEVGDTMTEYEVYTGDTYEVSLGRTVYGGTFNWSTGELVITHDFVNGEVVEKAEKESVTLESFSIYAISTESGINTIYSDCGITVVDGYSSSGSTGEIINSETIVTLKYQDKKLLAIGDSITQQGKYLTSLQSYVPFESIDNQGIGGSTVIKRGQASDGCVLIDSLEENVKNADVITIGYGTNDTNYIKNKATWSIGELVDYGSEFDKNTFYGAYQYVIEKILTWNPTAKLIFIVPAPSMIIDSSSMTKAEKRKLSEDLAKAVRDIANYYSYEYVDLYYKSGMNEFNRTIYAPDGCHPQEAFGDITAKKFIPILLY